MFKTRLFATARNVVLVLLGGAIATALIINTTSSNNPSATAAQQAIPASQAGTGYEPLTATEARLAGDRARLAPVIAARLQASQRIEELRVERHEEPKGVETSGQWPRRADVFLYDYDRDMTLHALVDVRSGTVESVREVQGMQLLITPREAARALQIALAHPQAGAAIRTQYQQLAGTALQQPSQLQVQAGVFHGSSMPELVAAKDCGAQRCAQLLIMTADGLALNVAPIVNLSRDQVVVSGQ